MSEKEGNFCCAKTIEFEPYWYFFDNGEPNENLKLLETILA